MPSTYAHNAIGGETEETKKVGRITDRKNKRGKTTDGKEKRNNNRWERQ